MAGLFNDNGTVNLPAALGVLGLAKLAQGAMRQHDINAAIDLENQGLPSGYQIGHQKGFFNWNDPATQQKAIQELGKTQMGKYNADDAKTGMLGQHYAVPFSAPANITNMMEKVYTPTEVKRGEYRAQQEAGGAEFKGALNALGLARQAMGGPQQPPASPNLPPMNYSQAQMPPTDATGAPVLTGGAQASGTPQGPTFNPLPQLQPGDFAMSPEMARQLFSNATTMRGQDKTAQTAANRLQFDQNKWDQGAPQRNATLKQTQANTQKTQAFNRWADKYYQAQIGSMNRANQPHGSTDPLDRKLDAIKQNVANGQLTVEEGQAAYKAALGVPNARAGGLGKISASEYKKLEQERKNALRQVHSKDPAERAQGRRALQHVNSREGQPGHMTSSAPTGKGGGMFGFDY